MVRIKLVPFLLQFRNCTFIYLIVTFGLSNSFAQEGFYLKLNAHAAIKPLTVQNLKPAVKYDSLLIQKEINQLLFRLHGSSYLMAAIEDWHVSKDTIYCSINIGDKITWQGIRIRPIPELDRRRLNLPQMPNDDLYSLFNIQKLENRILSYYENNGYPFASLFYDSLEIENNSITASILVKRGPLIVFDSVKILGNSKMKPGYLSKYLRMNIGSLYSTQKVSSSEKLIRQLPYTSMKKSPYIVFRNNKARVYYLLDEKKANQADGIIGFLPNSGSNSTLLITGEINLLLRNLFGRGLNLKGQWKSYQAQSQTLSLDAFYPNVLGSNIDADFGIDFLKQDSTFRTFQYQLKFSYQSSTLSKFSMLGGVKTSNLISTGQYQSVTTLPPYADFTYSFYGLGYTFNNLDDYYYPRKGWVASLDGTVGAKVIQKNAAVNEIAYNNIKLNTSQFTVNLMAEKHTKIFKNTIFFVRVKGGKVNNQNILINDLYRFGGFSTLRGFNENYFYASEYLLTNIEVRQFTDQSSYLYLFFDGALYAAAALGTYKQDKPFGFGAGASLTTSAGVFNFAYGLGQSSDQKINFNQSKIHFGYTSRF